MTQAFAFLAAPLRAPATYVTPEHLEVGNQVFDGSLQGFRAYLDTKKASDPQLFARLDPKVTALESRADEARNAMIAGGAVGVISTIYAFAGRPTCYEPQLGDPDFAAKAQAWGDCNSAAGAHLAAFTLIGLGAVTIGVIAAYVLHPTRSDVLDLVNENNRTSQEPIRLQLGYDPAGRVALGGVSTAF